MAPFSTNTSIHLTGGDAIKLDTDFDPELGASIDLGTYPHKVVLFLDVAACKALQDACYRAQIRLYRSAQETADRVAAASGDNWLQCAQAAEHLATHGWDRIDIDNNGVGYFARFIDSTGRELTVELDATLTLDDGGSVEQVTLDEVPVPGS